ncbi:testis-specific serine/threonine-protein kinase 6 [Notolabrus celidotus]|uniref:testis-specific serine/threonine-protein kinase 6 n=1 Tax=Notolabrus celidotus TaxID=1203425 RepID=UPI00148FC016|nr:testis-specific serine/threonine-protein kinase 6 [Notolabrus celidotus]
MHSGHQYAMNYKTFMAAQGYTFKRILGEGSFGKVVSAYSKELKGIVAIKIIDKEKICSNYLEKFLPQEMKIIRLLNHPNVVKTHDIFGSYTSKVYLVMELCAKGNLLDYINDQGTLPEPSCFRLFTQLCKAIKYLHKSNVAHRDIKCENLLLDKHSNLKVCDFGFSKLLTCRHGQLKLSETYCGTWSYAAPEILRAIPYNPKVSDVWSMGVVMYMMLCALMPYDTSSIKRQVEIQMQHNINFPDTPAVSSEAKDLIRSILHPDVEQRIIIRDILCSTWMLRKGKMEGSNEAPSANTGCEQDEPPDDEAREEEQTLNDSSDPGEGPSTAAPRH